MGVSTSARATDAEALARRYGRSSAPAGRPTPTGRPTRTRRALAPWIGGGIVALVILAVVLLMASWQSAPLATTSSATFHVVSPNEVTVTFAVTRSDPSVAVTCAVEATDETYAQVGAATLEIPPSEARTVTVSTTLSTLRRAEIARPIENGCFELVAPA